MLGLFFFSAIFNLALGYAVGRYFSPRPLSLAIDDIQRRLWSRRRRGSSGMNDTSVTATRPAAPMTAATGVAASAAQMPPAPSMQRPDEGTRSDEGSPDIDSSHWEESPDWKALDAAVAQVTSRIEYVQSIDDMTLGKEAISDFQKALSGWHRKLSDLLESRDIEAKFDSAELMLLEQFVAQIETTLANLSVLDWTDGLETIVARVEKEVRALNETRPQMAVEPA